MSASSNNLSKALQDLFIDWQDLVRRRAGSRQGTKARSELDMIYFKILPTIVQITEEIDDQRIAELVELAQSQLKQRDPKAINNASNQAIIIV